MSRSIQHTHHVSIPFHEACRRVDERGHHLLSRATAVAASAVSRAFGHHGHGQPGPTKISWQPLQLGAEHQATVTLDWHSTTPDRRLLPHLDARLVLNGVILDGPHASTAVSILGTFDPSSGLLRRIDDLLFRRRLVDEATVTFLDIFVAGLSDEDIDLRDGQRAGDNSSAA